jgi:hypothetical protein
MSLSDLSAKWNPKNLEIKTRSVEKTLEPLVIQVYTVEILLLTLLFNKPFGPRALPPDPFLVKQGARISVVEPEAQEPQLLT